VAQAIHALTLPQYPPQAIEGSAKGPITPPPGAPLARYLQDGTALLVRLHDGQLAAMETIAAGQYSAVHVEPSLRPGYEIHDTMLAHVASVAAAGAAAAAAAGRRVVDGVGTSSTGASAEVAPFGGSLAAALLRPLSAGGWLLPDRRPPASASSSAATSLLAQLEADANAAVSRATTVTLRAPKPTTRTGRSSA
jgi:hypothetical protein